MVHIYSRTVKTITESWGDLLEETDTSESEGDGDESVKENCSEDADIVNFSEDDELGQLDIEYE